MSQPYQYPVSDSVHKAVGSVGTTDPTGRDAHEPGAKLDAGKIRLALVMSGFAPALMEVGRVGTYGANKYTPNGWKDVPQAMERYQDAMLRHMTAYWGGEKDDPESSSRISHTLHGTPWQFSRSPRRRRTIELPNLYIPHMEQSGL